MHARIDKVRWPKHQRQTHPTANYLSTSSNNTFKSDWQQIQNLQNDTVQTLNLVQPCCTGPLRIVITSHVKAKALYKFGISAPLRKASFKTGYSGFVCANIKVACGPMRSCFGVMRSGLCSQGCQSHRSREPKTSLKCWTCVASSHIASMFFVPGPRMLLISDLRIALNDITFGGNVLETSFQAAHNYKTLPFHNTFAANARQQQLAGKKSKFHYVPLLAPPLRWQTDSKLICATTEHTWTVTLPSLHVPRNWMRQTPTIA